MSSWGSLISCGNWDERKHVRALWPPVVVVIKAGNVGHKAACSYYSTVLHCSGRPSVYYLLYIHHSPPPPPPWIGICQGGTRCLVSSTARALLLHTARYLKGFVEGRAAVIYRTSAHRVFFSKTQTGNTRQWVWEEGVATHEDPPQSGVQTTIDIILHTLLMWFFLELDTTIR